jgi:hypothetical protein
MRHLLVGGLCAMGLDESGQFLLTVSHSGRAVFSTRTWERVARDTAVVYPVAGCCDGIGPLSGRSIAVQVRDETRPAFRLRCGAFELVGESDGVTITAARP